LGSQAEVWHARPCGTGKEISDEALAELISRVGPHARQLDNGREGLAMWANGRIGPDVWHDLLATKPRAFALGDALGTGTAPVAAALDEELWEVSSTREIRDRLALRFD
jgi:hypothetical protein